MCTNMNIMKPFKILLMVLSVVFMLTACNRDNENNTAQSPMAGHNGQVMTSPELAAEEQTSCWQTEIINVLYDELGKVSLSTYRKMTNGALPLMMVAFAIWMAFRLLKQLSSLQEENLGQVWTEIAKMFFLCLVCGYIASEVDLLVMILGEFIFPIYNAFLEFASEILNSAKTSANSANLTLFGGENVSISSSFTCSPGKMEAITADSTGFPDSPKSMMDCMVCSLNDSLKFGMVTAYKTLTAASIMGYLVGFFLLICFLFVRVAFAFYLIDTIFRFAIMVVMLPLMIMGYPFKQTRKLLSSGINNMVNSAAFMMFFAIIISMCMIAIADILNQIQGALQNEKAFMDFSVAFICMMMVGFVVISSIQIAGKLCDGIVGGSSNAAFQKSAKALIVGAFKWVTSGGIRIFASLLPEKAKNWVIEKSEKYLNLKNKAGGAIDKATGK